jgi:hypothetical protein
MASTRNRNTLGNYQLFLKENRDNALYTLNKEAGVSYHTGLPGYGLLPGQLPRDTLSGNPVDTESFLFGINATNLVTPRPCFVPQTQNLPSVNVYVPKPVVMPAPFVLDRNRPYPI